MPVSSSDITNQIIASASFPGGPTWPMLAQAIGQGVATWATGEPTNLSLKGVTTGVAGAGVVSGALKIPPNPTPLITGLVGAGVSGVTSTQVAAAIATGLSTSISSSAIYTGASTGVSSGTDASSVTVSNPSTLVAALLAAMGTGFSSYGGGVGTSTAQIAIGLGNGIAALFLLGTGTGIVTPTSPLTGPATGTSPLSIVL